MGKSAAVAAAAAAAGRPLVRFNLSARTTPEDLLARPVLAPDPATGSEALRMQLQPFAVAFRDGAWLLLDELNLCPESVLLVGARRRLHLPSVCTNSWQGSAPHAQALERAMDSGVLELRNQGPGEAVLRIVKHPEFRLFAAQNPGTGRVPPLLQ